MGNFTYDLIVLFVLLTVSFQSIKAALANPVIFPLIKTLGFDITQSTYFHGILSEDNNIDLNGPQQ